MQFDPERMQQVLQDHLPSLEDLSDEDRLILAIALLHRNTVSAMDSLHVVVYPSGGAAVQLGCMRDTMDPPKVH